MSTVAQVVAKPDHRWMVWTGRVISAIPVLLLALAGVSLLTHAPSVAAGMKPLGYSDDKFVLVGVLALVSALLYALPRTAVLGAILITAFFGGAVATHVRVSDPGYPAAVVTGFLTWVGLYLRDQRLRALVPFRRTR